MRLVVTMHHVVKYSCSRCSYNGVLWPRNIGCRLLGVVHNVRVLFFDSMFGKDIAVLSISLFHLPIEGTGGLGEERFDGLEGAVAGFWVD